MKIGDKVKVTKVSGKPDATLQTGHTVTGTLGLLEEGKALGVYGETGSVVTTAIEMLTWDGDKKAYCHTKNSLWRVELLDG